MYGKFVLIVLGLLMVCSSCKKNSGDESKDGYIPVESSEISEGEPLKDWKCTNIENDLICTPNTWNEIKTGQAFFSSDIGENASNTYFVISKYRIDSTGLNARRQLAEIYQVLKGDTTEATLEYQLTELVFKDRTAYYGEFLSQKNGVKYSYFMMLWERDSVLYDLGLKAMNSEKEAYYKDFQTILYHYKIGGTPAFSRKDDLEKIKHLKFEEL